METRRVHLDFHTSEYIDGIGEHFDKKQFQNALQSSGVNLITLFAKCHHGYCYYPTKTGRMHPNLKFDLLKAQLDACKEIGIKAPIYITGSWSAYDATNHPEWRAIDVVSGTPLYINGEIHSSPQERRPNNSWELLCLAGEYGNSIIETTKEICNLYENIDGLFFDIMLLDIPCACNKCREGMTQLGYNPASIEDARKYMILKKQELMKACQNILKMNNSEGTIFFNSGGAEINYPEYHDYSTHFELEDLPTSGGGYDKFPLRAKYFAKLKKPFVGMTGKFHTDWGEFGTYKNKNALKYECASMLMYGAGCSIGDQLHPNGEMDEQTYDLIGSAFDYVSRIEQFCFETSETTRLGVVISKSATVNEGISKILLESQLDFDVIFEDEDLIQKYDLIILPGCLELSNDFTRKINEYIKADKALIVIGNAATKNDRFQIDIGLEYKGKSSFDIDYLSCCDEMSEFFKMPILCYDSAHIVEVLTGSVLAHIKEPYFSRTYGKYCSHRNTPNRIENANYPAIVRNGNIMYMAHDIGSMYFEHGCELYRNILIECIRKLFTPSLRVTGLMSSGRVHLCDQTQNNRLVLHLTYAQPVKRGNVLMIEDIPELHGINVEITTPRNIARAVLQPQNQNVKFTQENSRISMVIEKINCHQIVVLEY